MVYPRVLVEVFGLASPFFSRTQELAFQSESVNRL